MVVTNATSFDRVLVLKPIEGKPKSSGGVIDNRLFTGDNKLHMLRDPETAFWSFKYDKGLLPDQLRQSFTTYTKAFEYVKNYFERRNIEILDIVDA